MRSPSSFSASRRSLPSETSRRQIASSSPKGPFDLLRHLGQRGLEAEAGLDTGGDQVEGVRQALEDGLLAVRARGWRARPSA